jgi:hypothetical protein
MVIGSRLTDDSLVLRCLLGGLNDQGRQWQEIIIILDDGSLQGLEHEVEGFRHLEHRRVKEWGDPNIVLAFIDRLSQNRHTEDVLKRADKEGRPAFIISSYPGDSSEKILP